MADIFRKSIKVIEIRYPAKKDREELLEWIVRSLGITTNRDIDNTINKILDFILKKNKEQEVINEEEIAREIGLSRSTIHYHLEKLINSHLLEKSNKGYVLRGNTLEETIDEIKLEFDKVIEKIRRIAKELDEQYR